MKKPDFIAVLIRPSFNFNKDSQYGEAATRGVLQHKVFIEISQKSQEKTCTRASFSIKFFKKDSGTGVFLRTPF